MRLLLRTSNGATYKIKRSDGMKFLASRVRFSRNDADREYWAVWPKGHMEARMRFYHLHEVIDHLLGGWWPAEGAS